MRRSRERRLKLQQVRAEEKALACIGPQMPKHKECLSCGADISLTYCPKAGPRCRTCVKEYMAKYRQDHAERISQQKKEWAKNNQVHKAAMDRGYALANPEARQTARRNWQQRNPGVAAALKKQNKLTRAQRVPAWLTEDEHWMIAQAYELAAQRTTVSGFSWHVDHRIPLKGRHVSGLHVPENLQVLPAIENLRKSNQFEVR